jgi:replicative DNA helicase
MTGGVLPWEYVTCAAFSGVGKSTLLRAIAFNIYSRPDKDHIGLYIPLEETPDGILSRFDAMATQLSYKKIRQLGLSDEETEHWAKTAETIKAKMNRRDILIQRINGCTPDKVFAEIVRYEPDICFIDYVSLMRSSRGTRNSSMWQSITEITQDLKDVATTLEVPILAAAQTNRAGAKEGAELDNIAQSISIVQDSDIIIGLYADEKMKEEKRMEMTVKKNREGPLGKIACTWDHDSMVYREADMVDRFGKPGAKSLTKAHLAARRPRPTRKLRPDQRPRPTRATA